MVHFGGNNEERSASGFTRTEQQFITAVQAYPVGNFTVDGELL